MLKNKLKNLFTGTLKLVLCLNFVCVLVRKPELQGQTVEMKQQVSQRDYLNLLTHRDDSHLPVFKTRRCFLYQVHPLK